MNDKIIIPRDWWFFDGDDAVITDKAADWLRKEYYIYKQKKDAFEADTNGYFEDDRLRPLNPIYRHLSDEDFIELEYMIMEKDAAAGPSDNVY